MANEKIRRLEYSENADTRTVGFKVIATGQEFLAEYDKLPVEIQSRVICRGLKSWLADGAASPDKDEYEVISGRYASGLAGEWSTRGGGDGISGDLVTAVHMFYREKSEEEVRAALVTMSAEDRKELAKDPEVQMELNKIKQRKLTAKAKAAKAEGKSRVSTLFASAA